MEKIIKIDHRRVKSKDLLGKIHENLIKWGKIRENSTENVEILKAEAYLDCLKMFEGWFEEK